MINVSVDLAYSQWVKEHKFKNNISEDEGRKVIFSEGYKVSGMQALSLIFEIQDSYSQEIFKKDSEIATLSRLVDEANTDCENLGQSVKRMSQEIEILKLILSRKDK